MYGDNVYTVQFLSFCFKGKGIVLQLEGMAGGGESIPWEGRFYSAQHWPPDFSPLEGGGV